jgi:hypothetical protein
MSSDYERGTPSLGHRGDIFDIIIMILTEMSSSNLNKRRYAQNDDTLYVAPEDERTDYVRYAFLLLFHLTQLY